MWEHYYSEWKTGTGNPWNEHLQSNQHCITIYIYTTVWLPLILPLLYDSHLYYHYCTTASYYHYSMTASYTTTTVWLPLILPLLYDCLILPLQYDCLLYYHYCTNTYYTTTTALQPLILPLLYYCLLYYHYCMMALHTTTTLRLFLILLQYGCLLYYHKCTTDLYYLDFLCQLNFMEIIRLLQLWGKSGHPLLWRYYWIGNIVSVCFHRQTHCLTRHKTTKDDYDPASNWPGPR